MDMSRDRLARKVILYTRQRRLVLNIRAEQTSTSGRVKMNKVLLKLRANIKTLANYYAKH